MIRALNERSQAILKSIIDAYMETGAPVGSRTISDRLGLNLSPATIRGIMAELEGAGLLAAPHTSAGRLPTQQGLRFYIDGLMEVGGLSEDDRRQIELRCRAEGQSIEKIYESAGSVLSGLSSAVSLVVAPKADKPLKQIQFVKLDAARILIILVMQDGLVENRIMEMQADVPAGALVAAANYLNDRVVGRTISEARGAVFREIEAQAAQLDAITADLVKRGIALPPADEFGGHLIVRGQSRLLEDVRAIEDLEKARLLLSILEEQKTVSKLLESMQQADGIEIFIGTENRMFEHSGWSMILSPYRGGAEQRIVGAIGVIGPARLNYSRIIPIVDYTAKVMEKLTG